jgi:hypothetical protein
VLAKLPAAAADELHQLYTALVAAGASCSTAYQQQLLPLLQDLAGVLVHAGAAAAAAAASDAGSPASTAHQSSSSSSCLMAQIVDELAAYFASQGMNSCLQLLPQVMRQQPAAAAAADQAQSLAQIMHAAAAGEGDSAAPAEAMTCQQLLQRTAAPQAAGAAEDGQ